jgi:hypothetical protein
VFGNYVITLISTFNILKNIVKQILILYPLVTDISGRLYHDCIAQKIILQNHCMIDRGRPSKGKGKTHKSTNRQNQSTTGKLGKPQWR